MTTAPTPELRTLAEAAKGWATCNEAWRHAEYHDVAVVGGILDGEQYPVAQIEADDYGTDGESLKLAQFYAAANPGAVLALLDRIAELEARKPLPPTDMTPVQHVNALVGDGLTAQKVEAICEREPYDVTGVVLSLPDGRACIVNQSAVRWFRGKRDFWDLMHGEAP